MFPNVVMCISQNQNKANAELKTISIQYRYKLLRDQYQNRGEMSWRVLLFLLIKWLGDNSYPFTIGLNKI